MGTQLAKNKGGYMYLESPKEQLMKMLVEKTRTRGHMLSFKEVCDDPNMVNPNCYAFYFGSFREAAELAWKKYQGLRKTDTSRSDIIKIPHSPIPEKKKVEKKPQHFSYRMPTENNTTKNSGYTYDQVKGMLIAFYRRNGRMPTQADVTNSPNLPSWGTLCKFLGNKAEWEKLVPPSIRRESADADTSNNDSTTATAEVAPKPASELKPELESKPEPQPQLKPEPQPDPKPESSPKFESRPEPATPKAAAITTQQHWEGETLLVEITVLKPGSATPVKITLSV